MTGFQIECIQDAGSRTLELVGELDNAACDAVVTELRRALRDLKLAALTLDLRRVSFIDSAGLRTIVLIQRDTERHGIWLTVLPAPESLVELLNVTGRPGHLNLALEDELSAQPGFLECIERKLARDPSAPAAARAEVRESTEGALSQTELDTVVLLTSELVTNAVIHSRCDEETAIELEIFKYDDRVRVQVSEQGAGFDPTRRERAEAPVGGRGLLVVDRSASRWGAVRRLSERGRRFSVWFELISADPRAGVRRRPLRHGSTS